jgi:hypothetical protein
MPWNATAVPGELKVWAPLALIVATGFLVAYRYVGSPPPRVIRIATGAADGAYHSLRNSMRVCWLVTVSRLRWFPLPERSTISSC